MERSLPDFIKENQDTIHCLAMNGADVLFSAAAMAKSFGEPGPAWWIISQHAIEATAQLFACVAPPPEIYEEAFEGENKHCQCAEVGGQLFLEWLDAAGNRTKLSNSEPVEAKEIKNAVVAEGIATCNWVTVDGEVKVSEYNIADGSWPMWYIIPTLNTDCCSGSPSPIPVQPRPAPYIFEQYEARCGTEVTLIDSCIDRYGFAQNFYKVKEDYRECGGDDTLYYYWETIEGPYVYRYTGRDFSYQVYCDPPYAWPHPHAAIPSGGGGYFDPGLSPVQYHLDVGCTYNPETDDFDTKYFYNVEATPDSLFGLSRRMDALAWMINNAQLIPYTSCANEKPVLEGQWVTTRWESDQKMDHSGRRLRKLFRYRTKSTRDLGQLSAYWQDFTWGAGDVIVWHEGAWWGTPKVWAKSAEEGQRVIRHAATEAGLDPDQVGRWKSSSSRSPRYGMSGNMRILKKDGFPWVASRDGENWPNVLAQVRDS